MISLEEDVHRVFLLIAEIYCQSGHNCVLHGDDDKLDSRGKKKRGSRADLATLNQDQDDPTVALFTKILQSHQRISLNYYCWLCSELICIDEKPMNQWN